MLRIDGRKWNQARKIELDIGYLKYAEGSCLAIAGNTKILVSATYEQRVPPFLLGTGKGWITAEYSLLPRSTVQRTMRESVTGRLQGRTQEISRFIGRSLRSIFDLDSLGEAQIIIDCDVLQADGGTRTLAVNGGFCALAQCVNYLLAQKILKKNPIIENVSAISVGIVNGRILLDLNYQEDSLADVDMNLVMTESGQIVEIQSTAEKRPFSYHQFQNMFTVAQKEIKKIIKFQKECLRSVLK
ncbi:MAG: ribonuclease PH [candidate division WOR-3 bacterium]|nr:ribonuclease PH [candidate division WOR-3 bacterium]